MPYVYCMQANVVFSPLLNYGKFSDWVQALPMARGAYNPWLVTIGKQSKKVFTLRFGLPQTVLSPGFWANNIQGCLRRRFLCLGAWKRGGVDARLHFVLPLVRGRNRKFPEVLACHG